MAKTFGQFIKEDAPANAAGNGGVAGIGVGPKGEPGVNLKKKKKPEMLQLTQVKESFTSEPALGDKSQAPETFAGTRVFEVSSDTMHKSLHGKNRYHRYSRYVGEDETGQQVRAHGRAGHDVILKDATTAVMTYLKRRRIPQ